MVDTHTVRIEDKKVIKRYLDKIETFYDQVETHLTLHTHESTGLRCFNTFCWDVMIHPSGGITINNWTWKVCPKAYRRIYIHKNIEGEVTLIEFTKGWLVE